MIPASPLILLLLLLAGPSIAAGTCQNLQDNSNACSASSPCCSMGKCGSGAFYCMAGSCDPANSFAPDSCYETPPCKAGQYKFNNPKALELKSNYFGDPKLTPWVSQGSINANITNGYLELKLDRAGGVSEVASTRWLKYGTVTARIKSASSAPGVVSQFIIRDPIGNDISFNWAGSDPNHAQSHYNYKKQLTGIKEMNSPDVGDASTVSHDYTISWDEETITWAIDGTSFRTINRPDTLAIGDNDYKYPSTMSQIIFRVFDGGSGDEPTKKWAGSPTKFDKGSAYTMSVYWVDIKCQDEKSDYTLPAEVSAYEKAHNITADSHSMTSGLIDDFNNSGKNVSSEISVIPINTSPEPLAAISKFTMLSIACAALLSISI